MFTPLVLTVVMAASSIKMWVREPGDYTATPPPARDEVVVTVAPSTTRDLFDLQYAEKGSYRGMVLERVVGDNAQGKAVDTALLHFANGMIVPVALASSLMQKLFVAVERKDSRGEFVTSFPEVRKVDAYYKDNRPLTFSTNKVVNDTADKANTFSPWRHVDSLIGIELVQSEAYLGQFDVASIGAAGLVRYKQRCQFCHGARHVGASYGWDFVTPVALHTYRSPRSLYFHVKFRESDAPEKGIMMPPLSDFSEKDAEHLWAFLRALAENPLRPYKPLPLP